MQMVWVKIGWLESVCRSSRLGRQQGGEGIMIWALIIFALMVSPRRVSEGVKITAETYIAFSKERLKP